MVTVKQVKKAIESRAQIEDFRVLAPAMATADSILNSIVRSKATRFGVILKPEVQESTWTALYIDQDEQILYLFDPSKRARSLRVSAWYSMLIKMRESLGFNKNLQTNRLKLKGDSATWVVYWLVQRAMQNRINWVSQNLSERREREYFGSTSKSEQSSSTLDDFKVRWARRPLPVPSTLPKWRSTRARTNPLPAPVPELIESSESDSVSATDSDTEDDNA